MVWGFIFTHASNSHEYSECDHHDVGGLGCQGREDGAHDVEESTEAKNVFGAQFFGYITASHLNKTDHQIRCETENKTSYSNLQHWW